MNIAAHCISDLRSFCAYIDLHTAASVVEIPMSVWEHLRDKHSTFNGVEPFWRNGIRIQIVLPDGSYLW